MKVAKRFELSITIHAAEDISTIGKEHNYETKIYDALLPKTLRRSVDIR